MLDKLSSLTVVVVVHRSASVVVELLICVRQLHSVANAWQDYAVTVGRDCAVELYRTILVDSVNLVGDKLEVVLAKLLLVHIKSVSRLRVAVTVTVNLLASLLALALHHHADLQRTVLLLHYSRLAYYTMVEIVESELEPCVVIANTSVVIGRSAESVELRSVALGKYSIATIRQAV